MSSMTTQMTSLPPSVQGGRSEPGREVRANAGSADVVSTQQVVGSKSAEQTDASPVSVSELADAVSRISDHIQVVRRNLQFDLDKDSGQTVVRVIDAQTDEVVRQIPSEDVLKLAKHLEEVSGLLFKAEA